MIDPEVEELTLLNEWDIPAIQFTAENGKRVRTRQYQYAIDQYGTKAMIRVANTLGGWSYRLGASVAATIESRQRAMKKYSDAKAVEAVAADLEAVKGISTEDAQAFKRGRAESIVESVDEEQNNNYHELEQRIAILEAAIPLLNEKIDRKHYQVQKSITRVKNSDRRRR